jgi:hypothetical protein
VALPLVIDEEQIFSFKFWFDGTIHEGMYYRNDLYCKLQTFDIQERPLVYQLGCKLAKKEALIALTFTPTTCSLWGSLRSVGIKNILIKQKTLNPPNLDPSIWSDAPTPDSEASG